MCETFWDLTWNPGSGPRLVFQSRRKPEMDELESQPATARELVSLAREHGLHLDAVCYDWAFLSGDRFLCLWRKIEVVHYNLQGEVDELPMQYKESDSAFRG